MAAAGGVLAGVAMAEVDGPVTATEPTLATTGTEATTETGTEATTGTSIEATTETEAEPEPAPEPSPKPLGPTTRKYGLIGDTQAVGASMGKTQDLMLTTGAKWIRERFLWSVIEPSDDAWTWDRYDRLLIEASSRGLRVLPELNGRPLWSGGGVHAVPSDPAEYAEYAAQVVARYGPGGEFWDANPEIAGYAPAHFEIWNEPYFKYFSTDGVDPHRYARLFKAASQAGKAVNPRAKFLIEVASDAQLPNGKWVNWTKELYAAVPDLNDWMDGIAPHPYSLKRDPAKALPPLRDPSWHSHFRRIARIRERFLAMGGDKPFWITEVGWATCPRNSTYCVGESTAGLWMERLFQTIDKDYSSWVEAVFVYRINDLGNPQDLREKEHYFGLLRRNGTPKPSFHKFRAAALRAE